MKTLKKILLGILIVVALLVVIAFFLPQNVHVERSLEMNAPAKIVYNQVIDLHSWDKWAKWNQIDPEMKVEYINKGFGENAGYSWTSDHPNVGSGKLLITEAVHYDSIATSMDFMEEGTATSYFLFNEEAGKTNVLWGFDTDLGYNPIARWFGLMFDSMIGPDFEEGLENLKVVSETILAEKQPIVEIRDMPAVKIVSIRETIELAEIGQKMGEMYGKLLKLIEKEQLEMIDVPIAIYHQFDGVTTDIECGIPVNALTENTGDTFESKEIPASDYVHADHFGDYMKLEKTHSFIQEWMNKRQIDMAGGPIERYFTDPQNEPDTAKWHTSVYYPI
jgi:effector-binding domain-containing protein